MKSTRTLKTNSVVLAPLLSTVFRNYGGIWSAPAERSGDGALDDFATWPFGVKNDLPQRRKERQELRANPKRCRAALATALQKAAPLLATFALLLAAGTAHAQTTTFTYQGKLTDGGTPANAAYDLQFALFDSVAGGTQIGSTQTVNSVSVSGGIFTVTLDFGANAFPNANRFLEISVRPAGGGTFTTLSPRQQISSTPYAIRTLNAGTADGLSNACVACVQDSQINSVSGSKVSGTIPVASVPAGSGNYIQNAGFALPQTGDFNITGFGNVGGGLSAGGNLTASGNLFVLGNGLNQIVGPLSAPLKVQSATANYGLIHTDGIVEVGTWVGAGATGENSGWFGTKSSHPLRFFTANGPARMTIDTTGNVGIGTTTPCSKLHVQNTASQICVDSVIQAVNDTDSAITVGVFGYSKYTSGVWGQSVNGPGVTGVSNGVAIRAQGILQVEALGAANTMTQMCRNTLNQIATCASSLKFKTKVAPFAGGLGIVNRLHPISFTWKDRLERDLGLAAEDVAAVEPLLVTHNAKGEIEGVKYDRLTAVLVNAVKEQQNAIKEQQKEIEQLKGQVRQLQAAAYRRRVRR